MNKRNKLAVIAALLVSQSAQAFFFDSTFDRMLEESERAFRELRQQHRSIWHQENKSHASSTQQQPGYTVHQEMVDNKFRLVVTLAERFAAQSPEVTISAQKTAKGISKSIEIIAQDKQVADATKNAKQGQSSYSCYTSSSVAYVDEHGVSHNNIETSQASMRDGKLVISANLPKNVDTDNYTMDFAKDGKLTIAFALKQAKPDKSKTVLKYTSSSDEK